jgi:hypothetical protein
MRVHLLSGGSINSRMILVKYRDILTGVDICDPSVSKGSIASRDVLTEMDIEFILEIEQ